MHQLKVIMRFGGLNHTQARPGDTQLQFVAYYGTFYPYKTCQRYTLVGKQKEL